MLGDLLLSSSLVPSLSVFLSLTIPTLSAFKMPYLLISLLLLFSLSLSLSSLLPPLIALAFPPPSSAVVYNTYLVPDWSCVIVVTLSLPVAQIGLTPTGEFPSLY